MLPTEQIKITWIVDSFKQESIHRNGPNLTQKESYLGHLERRKDIDGDQHWGYVVNGVFAQARSYADARSKLEAAAIKLLN